MKKKMHFLKLCEDYCAIVWSDDLSRCESSGLKLREHGRTKKRH